MSFGAGMMSNGPLRSESSGIRQEEPDGQGSRPSNASPPSDLAAKLRTEQRLAWERGESVAVEKLLARYPQIAADSESVVDLIYHEYLLQEQSGKRPDLDAFVARFPEHAAALRMQIAFHLAVANAPADPIPPPAAGNGRSIAHSAVIPEEANRPAFPGYEVLG